MKYRKHSKRTIWEEELDSEESLIDELYKANVNNLKPYFDYKGKRYKCNHCGNEDHYNETEINKGNLYCRACGQSLYRYEG